MLNLIFTEMKKRILPIIMMMVAAFMATSAYAQPTTTGVATQDSYANVGNELTYTVDASGVTTGFTWAIRANTGNDAGSTTPTISSTTNSVDVDWSGTTSGDIYYLDVYYTDTNGCYSEMLTFQITISNAVFCIASSSGTVGSTSVDAPSVTETCSLIETNTSGNSGTSSGGDITDFFLTVTDGIPSSSYTVYYSVDGSEQTSVTISTDASGDGAVEVNVDFTDFAGSFTNDGTSDATVSIAATRAVDANSFETSADSACAFDVTVHPTPALSF